MRGWESERDGRSDAIVHLNVRFRADIARRLGDPDRVRDLEESREGYRILELAANTDAANGVVEGGIRPDQTTIRKETPRHTAQLKKAENVRSQIGEQRKSILDGAEEHPVAQCVAPEAAHTLHVAEKQGDLIGQRDANGIVPGEADEILCEGLTELHLRTPVQEESMQPYGREDRKGAEIRANILTLVTQYPIGGRNHHPESKPVDRVNDDVPVVPLMLPDEGKTQISLPALVRRREVGRCVDVIGRERLGMNPSNASLELLTHVRPIGPIERPIQRDVASGIGLDEKVAAIKLDRSGKPVQACGDAGMPL